MEINLLPIESPVRNYWRILYIGMIGIFLVCGIVAGLNWLTNRANVHTNELFLQSLQGQYQSLQKKPNPTQAFQQQQIQSQRHSIVSSLMQQSQSVIRYVTSIENALPDGGKIESEQITGNTVSISGSLQSLKDVTNFVNALRKVNYFTNVELKSVQYEETSLSNPLNQQSVTSVGVVGPQSNTQSSNTQQSNTQQSNVQPSNIQPSNTQPSTTQQSNNQQINIQPSNLQPSPPAQPGEQSNSPVGNQVTNLPAGTTPAQENGNQMSNNTPKLKYYHFEVSLQLSKLNK
jgi:Tfp pilus assembly protein PilN